MLPVFASRAELEAEQLRRLKWSIAHIYNNAPYYRAKCDAAGVSPDDVRSLGDLARFPFTLKSDFRDNYPFGMFAVPREKAVRIHASSGTTGKPTIVGYTRTDLDLWNTLIARCIRSSCAESMPRHFPAAGTLAFTCRCRCRCGSPPRDV